MDSIIVDLDGTLCDCSHRTHLLPVWNDFFSLMHLDPAIESTASVVKALNTSGKTILIVTARPDQYQQVSEDWLKSNGIHYDKIYMRKTNDFRKDTVVKEEILQQILEDGYSPIMAFDDRPEVLEVWRSYGISTFACHTDEIKMHHAGKQFLDIMVGPSGAGKSTYISKNYKPHEVISSDQIREENGWGHSPQDLAKTWNYVHGLIKTRTENHLRTVLDATNIKRKDRFRVLQNLPKGQFANYIIIDRPLDEKLKDKGWRPEDLVLNHDKTFKSQLKDILNGDDRPNVVVVDRRGKL